MGLFRKRKLSKKQKALGAGLSVFTVFGGTAAVLLFGLDRSEDRLIPKHISACVAGQIGEISICRDKRVAEFVESRSRGEPKLTEKEKAELRADAAKWCKEDICPPPEPTDLYTE